MGALLRDALRRLCVEAGWSYAVFWRAIGGPNPTQLVWEDGHCKKKRSISGFEAMDLLLKEQGLVRSSCNNSFVELECQADDNLSALVHKMMMHQVHVLGDGIIGRAALTGDHQWILRENFNGHGSEGFSEMNHQFLAGILTVAVIPVVPHGVVQLGSIQMVMEDIGFVNHVKCLFAHIGRVPGALLAITQKDLSQKSRILEVPLSDCHSENFGTKIDESMSAVAGGSNCQLAKSPLLTPVDQLPCTLFAPLHEKMVPAASEVPLIKQIIRATARPSHKVLPFTRPVAKPLSHHSDQLEVGNLGIQVLNPNSGVRPIQLALPHGSSSEVEGQLSIMTSGLSSCGSRFLEQELSVSGFRPEKLTNLSEPLLDDAKTNQLQSQCLLPGSLHDSEIVPLFGKFESLSNSNNVGRFSTLSGGTTGAISIPCPPHLSNQTNHSNGCDVISNESCLSYPSNNKSSRSILSAQKQGHKNNSFKDLDNLSIEFDVHGFCYGSLSGFPKDHRLSHETDNLICSQDEKLSPFFTQSASQNDLFDIVGLDIRKDHFHGSLDSMLVQRDVANSCTLGTDLSTCNTQLDVGPVTDLVDYDISCSAVFSEPDPDQLLDAIVSKASSVVKRGTDDSVPCKTLTTKINSPSLHGSSPAYGGDVSCQHKEGEALGLAPMLLKTERAGSASLKTEDCSQRSGGYKSQISLWVEDGQNMRNSNVPAVHCKRIDELGKLNRKRARPGESPRPRPKDRQMIQDRVKELREIVPNGGKCSIDALLEKTIKHMLFLQSVTKHADKLKETGEPKIISKDGGLLLKDNFEGGATWAFEVGSQSMICPIIVEDLNPPRQMLVEMLCEERGFFLEIADLIRGLGLTILKGVMEARKDKVWARFAVEANRDVTRMEIFLSLVRLLEPAARSGLKPEGIDSNTMPHLFHQPSIPATGSS